MNIQTYEAECAPKTCRPATIRERLEQQKEGLESQLKRVNEALDALNTNPETAKVLELISRV